MKIDPATYSVMKSEFMTIIDTLGLKKKDITTKVMWDIHAKANIDRANNYTSQPKCEANRILTCTLRPVGWIYNMGLNDNHIETALKKIISEMRD